MPNLKRPLEERRQDDAPLDAGRWVSRSCAGDMNPLSILYLKDFARRQLGTIVTVVLVVGVLCTLLVSTREPKYTSTALLVVDASILELTRGQRDRVLSEVDTEVEMLRAINIVERLAARLKFGNEPKKFTHPTKVMAGVVKPLDIVLAVATKANGRAPELSKAKITERVVIGIGSVGETLGVSLASPIAKASETEGSSPQVSSRELFALKGKFRVSRRGLTDVIAIEARAKTPERAAELANLYAEVYLDEQVNAKLSSIDRVEAALAQRVQALRAELSKAGAPITMRETYSDYLSRLNEIRQKRSVIMPDLRIAGPALPLEQWAFPSSRLLLIMSWLFALGLAVAVAFLRDRHFVLSLHNGEGRKN